MSKRNAQLLAGEEELRIFPEKEEHNTGKKCGIPSNYN